MLKAKKIFLLVVISALCFSALFACSSLPTFKLTGERQKNDYIVTSNGGMAVQYGNYVYFINGYRGYDDANGKNNVKVEKGGLFRAELNGERVKANSVYLPYITSSIPDNVYYFNPQRITAGRDDIGVFQKEYIEFKLKAGENLDYDDNVIDVVAVQQLGGKTVGTANYKQGGMFIFDNCVYYATPSNELGRDGAVEYTKTEFYQAKLDGSESKLIYKTKEVSDSSPYAFYKQNGKVYLVVLDGTNLISVAMTESKINDAYNIASDVESAVLPYNDFYFKGMPTDSLQDYIYYTRKVKDGDLKRSGNAIIRMRPNGSESIVVLMNGLDVVINSVRDNLLFYEMTEDGLNNIYYTNISQGNGAVNGTAVTRFDTYANGVYCFRPAHNTNIPYVLAANDSALWFIDGSAKHIVYNGRAVVKAVIENFVYFLDENDNLCRTEYAVAASEKSEAKQVLVDEAIPQNGFEFDFCAGYFVYFGNVDEWAHDYTFFKKIDLNPDIESVFVGQKIDADLKPEDDEDEE